MKEKIKLFRIAFFAPSSSEAETGFWPISRKISSIREITLTVDAESALSALAARSAALDPAAAAREALESRLKIARAVEQAVDKGLRVDRLRLDPISMVGRSLGRLIAALSGDGVPSPEIVAIARERTLAAERALEAFDEALPALQGRLGAEHSRIRAARAALAGRGDAESRAKDLELARQEAMIRAAKVARGKKLELRVVELPPVARDHLAGDGGEQRTWTFDADSENVFSVSGSSYGVKSRIADRAGNPSGWSAPKACATGWPLIFMPTSPQP